MHQQVATWAGELVHHEEGRTNLLPLSPFWCRYYGSEQGMKGVTADSSNRAPLWEQERGFDVTHPNYQVQLLQWCQVDAISQSAELDACLLETGTQQLP